MDVEEKYQLKKLFLELDDHMNNAGDKQPWDNRAMFDKIHKTLKRLSECDEGTYNPSQRW